jgi:peptidoglycan glycosyltransferase
MVSAVNSGTAQAASVRGMQVAGKTGSAQNPQGQTHAWFIGFAPAEQPRLAIAVMLENAGGGGAVAAPLARSLLAAAVAAGY